MKKAVGTLKLDLAQYREMEVFSQFASDLDEQTRKQLIYGQGLMRMLRQSQYHPYSHHQQVIMLVSAMAHVMVDVELDDVQTFIKGLLEKFETEYPEIGQEIDREKVLSDELKDKIIEVAQEYAKDFLKRNLDSSKVEKIGDNFLISKNDVNKLKKISCPFDINKSSSYIGNYNDYKISESQKKDINKEFNYQRKPLLIYNPIINKNKVLYPPPYKFSKWGAFSQNHFILSNIKNGFNKKGGLFSEFVKKNIDKLNVMKRDVIEKLKKEKENNKIQKEKNLDNMSYNNLNSYENYAINNLKYHSLSPSNSMKNMLIGRKLKEMLSHF
jgi:hypothetical protein